jgi:hypothetical protein
MGWFVSMVMLLGGFGLTQGPAELSSCTFSVREPAAAPRILGPEEITSRVRVLSQPDSPVAISLLDFGDSAFDVGGEYFTFRERYAIELVNNSDRVVRDTIVMVHVITADGNAGGGVGRRTAIAPGKHARIPRVLGEARGSAPRDEAVLLVGIQSVELDDCVYKPAMALPARSKIAR